MQRDLSAASLLDSRLLLYTFSVSNSVNLYTKATIYHFFSIIARLLLY